MSAKTDTFPREHEDSGQEEHQTEIITSPSRSIAEWTTMGISIAIIMAFIGVITWLQVTGNGKPVVISVEPRLEEVRHEDTGYYLPITVRNDGVETVENLRIEAVLTIADGTTENREFEIDFLVREESTDGIVVFHHDPADGTLVVGATSYRVP